MWNGRLSIENYLVHLSFPVFVNGASAKQTPAYPYPFDMAPSNASASCRRNLAADSNLGSAGVGVGGDHAAAAVTGVGGDHAASLKGDKVMKWEGPDGYGLKGEQRPPTLVKVDIHPYGQGFDLA